MGARVGDGAVVVVTVEVVVVVGEADEAVVVVAVELEVVALEGEVVVDDTNDEEVCAGVLEEEVETVEELCTGLEVEVPVFPLPPIHPRENTTIPTTSRESRIFLCIIGFTGQSWVGWLKPFGFDWFKYQVSRV